ncbi:cytochrome P450 [Cryphonectria parasitica EP155]|uniref:Cytochrome P450 n=1 Tax=Cryphonectria parasitica (strain ATCC 38755 / EP155) TaxID=660469 RepID=A0A9P4XVP4_CRYP1|nr:cytochrome P450 [Cryphonectria parasitica EP155]KAF3762157.1 cytochrome P450 [Cryphonectria parasitica EP155]
MSPGWLKPWNFVIGLPILAAVVALCQFLYNIYFHPLAQFPGPVLYRGSHLPKIIQQIRGTVHEKMLELHEQYGPVVRLAPNELTYTSATALREIYGNRGGKKSMPPQSTLGKHDQKMFGATAFLWLESHTEHLRHRRVLATSFSETSLRAQQPIILGYAELLTKKLGERASRGEVVDLWAWFNYLTFDVIGDLTFGEPFGCVKDGQFHPWISFIFSNLTNMMYAQMVTTMGYLGAFIEMLVPRKVWAEAISHAQATRDKVDRRLARKTDRPDFVTGFMKYINKPGGITSNELYADSNIFLMAGSETSATLLAAAVYYLLRSPDKLRKLEAEIRGTFTREEEIDFSSVSRLPYLVAVINEALRIHPSLPAGVNRTVPPGGAVIDGRLVAEGTILQVPHWAAFHLDANFRDPWAFVPERWLEPCPARFVDDNKDVFQPFSYGQRNCIGRSLAYMEAKITLSRLIMVFDMELMPESADWSRQKVFLLWEKRPLYVRLTQRSEGGNLSRA